MNFFRGTLLGQADGFCFVEEAQSDPGTKNGFQLGLEPALAAQLSSNNGRSVILGLRPEDVALLPGEAAPKSEAAVDAVVELVEPLGSETLCHLNTGSHSFVARLGAAERMALNQKVSVSFNLSKCHWFDPATSRAIA